MGVFFLPSSSLLNPFSTTSDSFVISLAQKTSLARIDSCTSRRSCRCPVSWESVPPVPASPAPEVKQATAEYLSRGRSDNPTWPFLCGADQHHHTTISRSTASIETVGAICQRWACIQALQSLPEPSLQHGPFTQRHLLPTSSNSERGLRETDHTRPWRALSHDSKSNLLPPLPYHTAHTVDAQHQAESAGAQDSHSCVHGMWSGARTIAMGKSTTASSGKDWTYERCSRPILATRDFGK